jgi:hypothetical protein
VGFEFPHCAAFSNLQSLYLPSIQIRSFWVMLFKVNSVLLYYAADIRSFLKRALVCNSFAKCFSLLEISLRHFIHDFAMRPIGQVKTAIIVTTCISISIQLGDWNSEMSGIFILTATYGSDTLHSMLSNGYSVLFPSGKVVGTWSWIIKPITFLCVIYVRSHVQSL